MATTAALSDNSHQGFEPEKPHCIGLECLLSRNSRQGCSHVYDETPVGLVVYVRNDPVNYVDPDGHFQCMLPACLEENPPPSFAVSWGWSLRGRQDDFLTPRPLQKESKPSELLAAAIGDSSTYFRVSSTTIDFFKDSPCASKLSTDQLGTLQSKADQMQFLNLADPIVSGSLLSTFKQISGISLTGSLTLGGWANLVDAQGNPQVSPQGMGVIDPGTPTNWVFVGALVYENPNTYGQELAAFHETLHYALGLNDVALANSLGLGTFTSGQRDPASAAISAWLETCFTKPK